MTDTVRTQENSISVPHLTKDDLVRGLRAVGLEAGQHVVVHSSLSRFGRVENGADDVIDALEEVITPSGTLVMPTFSSRLIFFVEAMALRRGINGVGATGRGVVYEGDFAGFWGEFKRSWEDAGMLRIPFASPKVLWDRISAEGSALPRWGFVLEVGGSERADEAPVRLTRDAPPRPAEDVKPWKMPVNTGIIPETFWRRPETKRSQQYSGSFTAWGALTDRILERHDNHSHQELDDHPLHRMKEAGGKVLLLGVNHGSNSTLHVAQSIVIRDSGTKLMKPGEEFLGHFQIVDEPLDRVGGQKKGKIGNAEVRLADTATMYEIVKEIFAEKVLRGFPQSRNAS